MSFFKKLFVAFLLLGAISCQKEYAPEPVTGGSSTGGGSSSGGGGSSVARLSKIVVVTSDGTVTRTYEYNNAGKLVICKETGVAAGQTIITTYAFNRDNSNKIVSYTLQYNIAGAPPDPVTYTCHYPAGSGLFDYATARFAFAGTTRVDSVAYGIVLGAVTSVSTYRDIGNTGYQSAGNNVYSYDNSGNVAELKFYGLSALTGNLDLVSNTVYSFDGKLNALQLGQEAFLLGDLHIGKNNFIKQVITNYVPNPVGAIVTNTYTYSYNTNNQPAAATCTDANGAKTVITYTYQ